MGDEAHVGYYEPVCRAIQFPDVPCFEYQLNIIDDGVRINGCPLSFWLGLRVGTLILVQGIPALELISAQLLDYPWEYLSGTVIKMGAFSGRRLCLA